MNLKASTLLLLLTAAPPAPAGDCALADDLVYRANDLYNRGAPADEPMALLTHALAVCPGNVHAHNNLANHLGDQGRFAEAEQHYRAALAIRPGFAEAWFGLGETYRAWGRRPRSLEAFLHLCRDPEARRYLTGELLKDDRFLGAEAGEVLDRESLALLFDPARRKAIAGRLEACGIGRGRAVMEARPVLRNFLFATGRADLSPAPVNRRQLDEIAAALARLPAERRVRIHGHSDDQPFARVSPAESDRLNLALSRERAETIRAALVARGLAPGRIAAEGHGDRQPVSDRRGRNRRVEIEVQ